MDYRELGIRKFRALRTECGFQRVNQLYRTELLQQLIYHCHEDVFVRSTPLLPHPPDFPDQTLPIWWADFAPERTKYGKHQPKFVKVSILLDCPTISSREFVAVDEDVCSKTTIDADSEKEHEMNNAVLVPTSSERRNIM
ncbi:hypothetical protein TNCV_1511331 [Trichonephila clavipes]|nr:hypothetical protein TNCV_1511331 [Trichonephila clavipes]